MIWRLSRNYGNDEGGGAGTEGIVFQRGNKHRHDSPLFHYTTLPFVIMEKIHISFVICYKVEMPYVVSHYFFHRKLRIVIYDTILKYDTQIQNTAIQGVSQGLLWCIPRLYCSQVVPLELAHADITVTATVILSS